MLRWMAGGRPGPECRLGGAEPDPSSAHGPESRVEQEDRGASAVSATGE